MAPAVIPPPGGKALTTVQLAGAGFSVVATIFVGLLLGLAAAKYLHWLFAIPVGLILGFVAGIVSLFRQLAR